MVAITVILAAVIAAFVFGMGSTLKKTYNVGTTVSKINTSTVRVVYAGGPDAGSLDYMTVTLSQVGIPSGYFSGGALGRKSFNTSVVAIAILEP